MYHGRTGEYAGMRRALSAGKAQDRKRLFRP